MQGKPSILTLTVKSGESPVVNTIRYGAWHLYPTEPKGQWHVSHDNGCRAAWFTRKRDARAMIVLLHEFGLGAWQQDAPLCVQPSQVTPVPLTDEQCKRISKLHPL